MLPTVCAAIISVVPLFGYNYNYNGIFFCDIAGSPVWCNYPSEDGGECVRGAESEQLLLYVGVVPFMVAFAIIISSVALLIHSVLKQERRMDRFQRGGAAGMPPRRKMTTQATRQGIYYVGAFGLCWIPWYICEYNIFRVVVHLVCSEPPHSPRHCTQYMQTKVDKLMMLYIIASWYIHVFVYRCNT